MKNIQKLIGLAGILCYGVVYSQYSGKVGINTNKPQVELDVQGSLGIRNLGNTSGSGSVMGRIRLGGDNGKLGVRGTIGNVLVSQGPGKPPVWKYPRRPIMEPGIVYSMNREINREMEASKNNTNCVNENNGSIDAHCTDYGLSFAKNLSTNNTSTSNLLSDASTKAQSGQVDYSKDMTISQFIAANNTNASNGATKIDGNWAGELKDLKKNITMGSNDAKSGIVFNFQTLVHSGQLIDINSNNGGSIEVACGVFVNDKLKGVRVESFRLGGRLFKVMDILGVANDGLVVGTNTVQVACAKRAFFGANTDSQNEITIGRVIGGGTNQTYFTTQSMIKLSSYEQPKDASQ